MGLPAVEMGLAAHFRWFLCTGGRFLDKQLWEICREQWQTLHPRKTYQDVADESGISVNAVAQFLRGETKNTYIQTAAPICKALHVSIDAVYGIKYQGQPEQPDELQQELAHTKHLLRIYARGVRVRTGIIFVLCAVLTLALIALIIDLRNPNVGWVRTALRVCAQV